MEFKVPGAAWPSASLSFAHESTTSGGVRVDTADYACSTSQMNCPSAYSWRRIFVDPEEG